MESPLDDVQLFRTNSVDRKNKLKEDSVIKIEAQEEDFEESKENSV